MSWVWAFLDAGLDPSETERSLLDRVRVVNLATAVLVAVGSLFVGINLAADRAPAAAGLAFTISLASANVWLLRRTHRIGLAGTIFSLLCMAHLADVAIEMRHPALYYWFFLIPLLGALVGGLRAGWVLSATAIAIATYLYTVPGQAPPEVFSAEHLLALRVLSMLGLTAFMTIFVRAQLAAQTSQRESNEQLLRETLRVRLMSEVAISANRASEAEEALRTCVERVCALTGWPVGFAWTLGPWSPAPAAEVWQVEDDQQYDRFKQSLIVAREIHGKAMEAHLRRKPEPFQLFGPNTPRLEPDVAAEAVRLGLTSGMVIPVLLGGEVGAILSFFSREPVEDNREMLDAMAHVGAQIARVAERKRADARIRYLAYYDGLTGLPNRQLFATRLERSIQTARHKRQQFALLYIDLDGFKRVNDSLGHAAGDELLQQVANRLLGCVRMTDVVSRDEEGPGEVPVARLAGDEFTMILADIRDPQDAGLVARRVLDALAEPIELATGEVIQNASVGVAIYPADAGTPDALLACADAAMYYAKSEGRNCFHYYSVAMNDERARALEIETRLRSALARDDFTIMFQPLRDARTSELTGAEVLLRWKDAELGSVAPTEFIPIAEKTGLIIPIGSWVLRTACAQMAAWREAGLRPIRLSVNVSSLQLRAGQLIGEVKALLAEHEIGASQLELEITEGTIMQDDEETLHALEELDALGISIALDDFGVGYSSLSYLRRFPIRCVKIDRSFVAEMSTNADDRTLTGAIVAMAHSLRMRVVAEGVETRSQAELLSAQGCDELQGYLFSRPVRAAEFERFLEREKPIES